MNMKALHFFPSQPEIQYKVDNYKEYKPFSSDIALYYQFKTSDEPIISFGIIPDGSYDLLFCCSPNHPSAFLWTSPFHRREQRDFHEGCEYFGVRLFPEQRMINFKYPMRELLDRKIPLEDLINMDVNIEQLLIGKSFEEKIRLFEEVVGDFENEFSDQDVLEYSINKIYLTKGNISINQLTIDTGYSDRYLRNKFAESIGFSPKQFSEIVKFQNSLAMIVENNSYNSIDVINESGYHDYAHFIRRFKKFANFTPAQFIGYLDEIS